MNIVFRTDASINIGTGHVMRCLTLAEELEGRGANCSFVCREHKGHMFDMIQQRGYRVFYLPRGSENLADSPDKEKKLGSSHALFLGVDWSVDANQTKSVLGNENFEWLVVDHYGIDRQWERVLRQVCKKLMVIDDLADRHHDCDLLLDQNLGRIRSDYKGKVPKHCTILTGPKFALLRPEFEKTRKLLQPRNGEVRRVFLFFGGTDPDNITGCVLSVLDSREFSHLYVDVVIGNTNPHRSSIERQVVARPHTTLHVQTDNIAGLMALADLAIGAGGGTTWERLCLGLPSLVISIADNQIYFMDTLHRAGLLTYLGTKASIDQDKIRHAICEALNHKDFNHQQSIKGIATVSGDGTMITAKLLTSGISPKLWRIRVAKESDCELFWHWVNDAEVRRNAFHTEEISWKAHYTWFHDKLIDVDAVLMVIECKWGPVGQVRFERIDEQYFIDYSLGRQFRGLGLGRSLLKMAIDTYQKSCSLPLIAEVQPGNLASIAIFRGLNFSELTTSQNRIRRFQLCIPIQEQL